MEEEHIALLRVMFLKVPRANWLRARFRELHMVCLPAFSFPLLNPQLLRFRGMGAGEGRLLFRLLSLMWLFKALAPTRQLSRFGQIKWRRLPCGLVKPRDMAR